jgi:hypothetical protein
MEKIGKNRAFFRLESSIYGLRRYFAGSNILNSANATIQRIAYSIQKA